jgi:type II secretory pathway pseudopilin PulG
MLAKLRTRLGGAADSSGQSLVELMVVMGILTALMATVVGTLVNTQQQVRQDSNRLDQGQQATVGAEAMTKTMRTAVLPKQLNGTCSVCDASAFLSGGPRSVSFYANLNNLGAVDGAGYTTDGPSKVSYIVSTTGILTETVQRTLAHLPNDFNFSWCDPTQSSCVKTTRILARNVSTSATLFTFYDKTGGALVTPLESSATNLAAVDSLDISLSVRVSTAVPASTIVTRVTLPNADTAIPPTTS